MTEPTVSATHKRIHLLPEHLIDQIKAGEVIERPASLIKEVLENSIDAGASKISIHIVNNGLDLISIEDNGKGMFFDELPLAFCRHATSKIDRFEDLYKLHTFGFRGEALASIASIARVTASSAPKEEPTQGGKIQIEGGKQQFHLPYQNDKYGTTLIIKDLFFNTPVRLNFVKSQTSEKNALKRMVHSFLIANPQVEFHVKWDNQEKEIYPPVLANTLNQRLEKIFFRKNFPEKELFHFDHEYEDHRIRGWVSKFSSRGGSGKHQFLFANKRYFLEKTLHQHITKGMEGIWNPGTSGHYVLLIDVPVDKIDVNVHPNKTHIKFGKSSLIHSLIKAGIEGVKEKNYSPQESIFEENLSYHEDVGEDFLNTRAIINQGSHTGEFFENLDDQFALLKNESQFFILNKMNLFQTWLEKNLIELNDLDSMTTPLLIAEPLNMTDEVDRCVLPLRKLGFELERIDEQTLLLKSIPNWMKHLEPGEVIHSLVLHWKENNKFDFSKSFICPKKLLPAQWISLNEDCTNEENSFKKELSSKSLEKLWLSND